MLDEQIPSTDVIKINCHIDRVNNQQKNEP